MRLDLQDGSVFLDTGDEPLDLSRPLVLLVHGAGMNRTVWSDQARRLRGERLAAAAVDLPGHGRSEGELLHDVAAMGDWIIEVVDALGSDRAALVGHSMGSLAVLEAAARHPDRVDRVSLVATADVMPVHARLMEAAHAGDPEAVALVTKWSLSRRTVGDGHSQQTTWMAGGVLTPLLGSPPEVLATDLAAIDAYRGATSATARLRCPLQIVIGTDDRMTPPAAARRLGGHAIDVGIVELDTGHMPMLEDPDGLHGALTAFLVQKRR